MEKDMSKSYSCEKVQLLNHLRKLWSQHVYWTRFFIISTAEELSDLKPVTNRLLQNPKDFSEVFKKFYGVKKAEIFKKLFTEHLLIAADLVNAAKNGDTAKADEARKKWYKNADEISEFLSDINLHWSKIKWQKMMYNHLEMTEKEAALRLRKDFVHDIDVFDMIEKEALEMADYMFNGMTKQFCTK